MLEYPVTKLAEFLAQEMGLELCIVDNLIQQFFEDSYVFAWTFEEVKDAITSFTGVGPYLTAEEVPDAPWFREVLHAFADRFDTEGSLRIIADIVTHGFCAEVSDLMEEGWRQLPKHRKPEAGNHEHIFEFMYILDRSFHSKMAIKTHVMATTPFAFRETKPINYKALSHAKRTRSF